MNDLTKYGYKLGITEDDFKRELPVINPLVVPINLITRALSLSDVHTICATAHGSSAYQNQNSSILGNIDFTGTKSLEEARNLLLFGDLERLRKAEPLLASLNSQFIGSDNESIQRVYRPGSRLIDRARFKHGDPVPVYRNRELLGDSNRITCLANFSYNCMVSQQAITAYGIAIMAVLKTLEISGYTLKLMAANPVSRQLTNTVTVQADLITLKEYDGYIDPAVVAFWFGHPSALRRIGFRINEHHPDSIRLLFGFRDQCGYGHCFELPGEALSKIGIDIYFPTILSFSSEPKNHLIELFSRYDKQFARYGLTLDKMLASASNITRVAA